VAVNQISRSGSRAGKNAGATPIQLSKISTKNIKRLSSNISEFDRVLGGGFVPGQVVLLAGALSLRTFLRVSVRKKFFMLRGKKVPIKLK